MKPCNDVRVPSVLFKGQQDEACSCRLLYLWRLLVDFQAVATSGAGHKSKYNFCMMNKLFIEQTPVG